MANVVKVDYKLGKNLPIEVRQKNNFKEDEFIEVRIENSEPSINFKRIDSPSRRVKEILQKEGVSIKL